MEAQQIEQLNQLRRDRDDDGVSRSLDRVRDAARGSDNLVGPILQAVESLATVGEISDALRDVFGEHRESVFL